MVMSTRDGWSSYYYDYPTSCTGNPSLRGSFQIWYESVESYRGHRTYVSVGKKRRETFHAFERWKHSFGEPSIFRWCPPARTKLIAKGTQEANVVFCMGIAEGKPNPYTGDWPIIGKWRVQRHAAELQTFVSRDLYVKATEPRFDGLVFLAELDETLVGIQDILKGTVKGLTNARQGMKTVRELVSNPQSLWLWYRYALMPAILSVNDLLGAFKPRAEIDRIQTGSRPKTTRMYGTLLHPNWNLGSGDITLEIPWESEVTVRAGGALDFYFLHDPHEWGFSSVDILRASYERIPYSFVFDWFVNLGDFLQTLRNIEFDLAQSYVSTVVDTVTEFKPGKYCMYEGENPKLHCFLQQRITGIEPPTKPLIDRKWVTTLRTIDSISLIVGFLKGLLQKKR